MSDVSVLNVHSPTSSFAVVHSLANETLTSLFDKLTKKAKVEYQGARVSEGWLKYEWRGTVWNLDDDSDYMILKHRQSTSQASAGSSSTTDDSPTLYLHNPLSPLPEPPTYCNPSYYVFRDASPVKTPSTVASSSRKSTISKSIRSSKSGFRSVHDDETLDSGIPKHKVEFDRFHSENGVRTVIGTIGTIPNVRMLLKSDHRNVYVARKFAVVHGLVPGDATPGQFGYTGLVNIGKWPITLGRTPPSDDADPELMRTVTSTIYLSEEPHFDVILGRSFFEARRIRIDPLDPTDVRCMDTGERLECEVVVLRDGKGEIVTVT